MELSRKRKMFGMLFYSTDVGEQKTTENAFRGLNVSYISHDWLTGVPRFASEVLLFRPYNESSNTFQV